MTREGVPPGYSLAEAEAGEVDPVELAKATVEASTRELIAPVPARTLTVEVVALPHLAEALAEVPSRAHRPERHPLDTPENRQAIHEVITGEPFTIELGKRVELTPEQIERVNAALDLFEPCPYDSGPHRPHHTILARREWSLRVQHTPLELRVAAVLVSGAVGDYTVYMAIADDDSWVADHGSKLAFADALLLFPGITQKRYRS